MTKFLSTSTDNTHNKKITLSGFNNLTKILSFNLYDFCIAFNEEQKLQYVNYINEKYSADKLTEISSNICKIIDANILSISKQDYEPVGASSIVLMSDIKGGGNSENIPSPQVSLHLDKSHITTHTYPDVGDLEGVCSFRVDIDIATCGEIIPLNAINYLFKAFECDVVFIDYVVRGFTRLNDGQKIYNDHNVNSIKEFIDPEILKNYKIFADINLPNVNIWQTKLLLRDEQANTEKYLMDSNDLNHPLLPAKVKHLFKEMKEIFHLVD